MNIIGMREQHQPYGIFLERGTYYAAPVWFIEKEGHTAIRIWKPKKKQAVSAGPFRASARPAPRAQFST